MKTLSLFALVMMIGTSAIAGETLGTGKLVTLDKTWPNEGGIFISGPAAEALWNEMTLVQAKPNKALSGALEDVERKQSSQLRCHKDAYLNLDGSIQRTEYECNVRIDSLNTGLLGNF